MGSGKSTVAFRLAGLLDRTAVDLDRVVERRAGKPIARIFEEDGEPAFRRLEARALVDELNEGKVVALGGGAVLDDASWKLIKERAVSVWLDASLDVLWRRAGADTARPLALDREAFDRRFAERRARYAEADYQVAAEGDLGEVAKEVVRRCGL
jgi:shikimate kinase